MQVRSQVAADREMRNAPPEILPLEAGFIDLPQELLDRLSPQGRGQRPRPRLWPSPPTCASGRPRRLPRRRRLLPRRPRPVRGAEEHLPQRTAARDAPRRAAHLLRGRRRRQRRLAGTARPAADHLRRSGAARGALGGRLHQQVRRDPGAGRRPARLPPRGGRILRSALGVAAQAVRGRDRPGEQAARPVQGATATATRAC